jgi:cytochrome P450
MTILEPSEIDLTDATKYRDGVPHEVFAALRRAGPVHRHQAITMPTHDESLAFWSVVTHAEIQMVNRDWHAFSAADGPGLYPTLPERRGHTIVGMDPPDHSRLRRLISAGFTPRMIGELEGHIIRRTGQVLDAVADREACDFVADVAYQLPMHVIADIVGIPEEDRPWVFNRTDTMLRGLDPASPISEDQRLGAERDLFDYAQALGRSKTRQAGDDVWTTLINATLDDDEGNPTALSELELDMFFVILTLAGSETTRNAISQGLVALIDHPDQLRDLRLDPTLLGSATDELIRWASPVLYFGRTATADIEFGGAQIRAGDRVVMWYPSGNRDDSAFADPFRFDIRRSPNPHVSFGGGGPHYCLGASLAKKEVQVMIGAVVSRFSTIELDGPPVWLGSGPVHNVGVSLDRLPVRLR